MRLVIRRWLSFFVGGLTLISLSTCTNAELTITQLFSTVNFREGSVLQTGFIRGTCPSTVTSIEFKYDDQTAYTSAASPESWSFELPRMHYNRWKEGSSHTLSFRFTYEGETVYRNYSVTQGRNMDVDGDGYDDLLTGAPEQNIGGIVRGGAYLYWGSSSGVSSTRLDLTSGTASDVKFGFSVAIIGDIDGDGFGDIGVGAYRETNTSGDAQAGRAYIFYGNKDRTAILASMKTVELDTTVLTNRSWFGYSIAGAGDLDKDGYADYIIGALGSASTPANGYAYVFYGAESRTVPSPNELGVTGCDGCEFGAQVAGVGDVNGDGYQDVMVGEPKYDSRKGRAYLFAGSSTKGSFSATAIESPLTSDTARFGWGVSRAGAEGFLVGAYYADSTNGAAYFFRSGSSYTSPFATLSNPNSGNARFGLGLCLVGDVNGDGTDDYVVGAYSVDSSDGTDTEDGRAFLFLGSSSGGELTLSKTFINSQHGNDGARFGSSVGNLGDVNRDGYIDLAVGAMHSKYDVAEASLDQRGTVFVYNGSASGFPSSPTTIVDNPTATGGGDFGWTVSSQ